LQLLSALNQAESAGSVMALQKHVAGQQRRAAPFTKDRPVAIPKRPAVIYRKMPQRSKAQRGAEAFASSKRLPLPPG